MAGGGAGVINLSLSDDALGYGDIVGNIFCGFDKKCRREKNRTPDAPDIYNFSFNRNESTNSNSTTFAVIILIAAAGAAAIYFLT